MCIVTILQCQKVTKLCHIEKKWLNQASLHTLLYCFQECSLSPYYTGSRHGRDRTVVGFTTTCAISGYHH